MAFPQSFLRELTERNDIEEVVSSYVRLTKRSGSNLFGLCPFHNEKTPSFSVSPDKQIYHCFGCGKGGGVINFIMEIENLSYPDAVRFLAKRANMTVPDDGPDESSRRRERMLSLNRDAARFFHSNLTGPGGGPAREYVSGRGISPAMVTRFGLGYAPDSWDSLLSAMTKLGYSRSELVSAGLARTPKKGDGGVYDYFRNRLMFPVIDVRGSVIGFSGRALGDGEPKYLNSPETYVFNKSRNLFALNLAKKSKKGYIILSEGNIDVVALHQAGLDCAVASLGTSLTPEQARLISNYTKEVIIAYDADSAGRAASRRAIGILEKLDLKVKVLRLNGAKDPDEYIARFGAAAFENLLSRSEGHIEYGISELANKHSLTDEESRVAFLKEAMDYISSLSNAVEREIYSAKAADMAKISTRSVTDEVERLRKKKLASARRQEERAAHHPLREVQPKTRSIHYEDARSAVAEEGVLRLLWLEPELFDGDIPLKEEDFSVPLLGRLYSRLISMIQGHENPSVDLLADSFTPDEISHFIRLVQKPQELQESGKALKDYINAIQTQKLALRGKDSPGKEELLEMSRRLRESKGYGGKK